MIDFLLWYVLMLLLGWAAFPIAFRLLPKLRDRGFGLSKVLGLLVWTYLFWLTNILHFNQNTVGGILFALALMLVLSWLCVRNGRWNELKNWIREHGRVVITTEIVFLFLFAFWAFIRATGPDVSGTEKPMEMAFISSILRSNSLPAQDPWLAGYAISYYYLGYVMAALLIKITGVLPWVGFNLVSALWFALTGIAAYSVVYSLIAVVFRPKPASDELDSSSEVPSTHRGSDLFWALLGPLYVLIVSNAEGFLEMLHSKGLFWTTAADGSLQSKFWTWLDIREIADPPTPPFSWTPERLSGIWWWRASRVLQDYTATGDWREIIDEFPFFSYFLADLHPHVLAMPFAILAIGLAFNFFLSWKPSAERGLSLYDWATDWFARAPVTLRDLTIGPLLSSGSFWAAAFLTGSLAFLNTWDFPFYVGLFAAVYAYHRYQTFGWSWSRLVEFITFALLTGIFGILFFFPFYIGFSSQAGGFLPSLFFFTRGANFWVMFLPLLFPLCWWLLTQLRRSPTKTVLKRGLLFAAIVLLGLGFLSYLIGGIGVLLPSLGARLQAGGSSAGLGQKLMEWGGLFFNVQGISNPTDIWQSLRLRLTQPGMWLTAGLMVLLVWGLLSLRKEAGSGEPAPTNGSNVFILQLMLLGLGLVIFPEFFYLRDQFGYRINTIFKFYFQTWILWSISAAAVSVVLWRSLRGWGKAVFCILWTAVLLICLAYPFYGLSSKIIGLDWKSVTLDGAIRNEALGAGDLEAIQWLLNAEDGVLVEAVGGSYTGYARAATFSGMPTLLGWPGHEAQWRGSYVEMGTREDDVRQIYQSNSWEETLPLLQKYRVNYIYVGTYEYNTYNVNEDKFMRNLGIAYQNEAVRIYEVTQDLQQTAGGLLVP